MASQMASTTGAGAWRGDVALLAKVAALGLLAVITIVTASFWSMPPELWQNATLPTSITKLQQLERVLREFQSANEARVIAALAATYMYIQTFAIPGTIFMNLLIGALLGFRRGIVVAQICSTAGALACFAMSKTFGQRIVERFFFKYQVKLQAQLDRMGNQVVVSLIFLRMFPMTPNWAVNIICGHISISVPEFVIGFFFGLLPYNILTCKTGEVLKQLRNGDNVIDRWTTGCIALVAVCGLLLPHLLGSGSS